MSAARQGAWAALALALLALALLASAQASPLPGGTVPSTLELSLGEPGPLRRTGSAHATPLYTATVRAGVTATDAPLALSVKGGDADPERRLRSWREPVAGAGAWVRLRVAAPSPGALRARPKLFVVTLTAGGP